VCLGLHSPATQCADCGTPRPCLVTDFYDWIKLRQQVWTVYRESVNDHCEHSLAILRAVEQCECSARFVRRTIATHDLTTLI